MVDGCKVVFFGQLQEGFTARQVVEAFSEKFSVSREKAEKLLNSNREVVLKGGLDRPRAEKYQKVLERIGLVVRVDAPAAESGSTLSLEPVSNGGGEETEALEQVQGAVPASVCPKCGSSNMQDGICQDCGVVAAKYLAMQAQLPAGSSTSDNPYGAPQAELLETEVGDLSGPHEVPWGHGWAWLVKGWWHFKQNPIAWIMAMVVWFVLAVVASMIPLLGSILVNLISPVITAGFFIGARAQDEGEDFTVGHLFAGFSNNPGQLVLVGLIYFAVAMLLLIVIAGVVFVLVGGVNPQDPKAIMTSPGVIIGVLFGLLLFIPLMMAYLFAPALVALEDLKALEAMKLSFGACMKNLLPFTLYGLISIPLLLLGALPFGLGLLILLPLLMASLYSAYQDIFYEQA